MIPKTPSHSLYANLTIDELFYPTFQFYSRWFMGTVFILSTAMYGFAVYVVTKKSSKAMGLFKYTTVCQLTCNMITELFLFLMNPVAIFPLPMIAMYTYFPVPLAWVYPLTVGLFFLPIIGAAAAFFITLSFRVYVLFNIKFLSLSRNNYFIIFAFYLIATSTVLATVASKFLMLQITFSETLFLSQIRGIGKLKHASKSQSFSAPIALIMGDVVKTQEIFESDVPALTQLYKMLPVVIAVILNDSTQPYVNFFLDAIAFWFALFVIAIFCLNGLFYYQMRKINKRVSKEVYVLQKMLHRYASLYPVQSRF